MLKKLVLSILFVISFTIGTFSQTTLTVGEIAIVAMNSDGTDNFSFVLLRAISSGTEIKFSESGWLNAGGFRGGGAGSEGLITWTASSALVCGTEISITANGSTTSTGSTSVSGSWALSASGDQILAYQGAAATPTFIYAVNNSGAGGVWQADATSTTTSALPTGLTDGTNAVALVHSDNQRYDCSVLSPEAATLAAISDNTNWSSDNSTPFAVPLGCAFSCTPCVATSEPTTNASVLLFTNISANSIQLDWTNGNGANRIVVMATSAISGTPSDQTHYNASTTFGNGSTIAPGEYVIFNGAGSAVTAIDLTSNTTYHFAIFEYNGVITDCEENYLIAGAPTGSQATTVISTAQITGIHVNACLLDEGLNEIVTFRNGTSALSQDSITLTFPQGTDFCNSGCGGNTWTTNAVYVAQLNTTAGCAGLFVEADPIPAGEAVFIFSSSAPTFNYDYTNLCGSGTYYVMFANSLTAGGRLANSGACASGDRTTILDIGVLHSDSATYNRCNTDNLDGDFFKFTENGTATLKNDGCTPTSILPITLLDFNAQQKGNRIILEWLTSSEINNDFFTIEKSSYAIDFSEIGIINGAGNSNKQLSYQFIDIAPYHGVNYYRLKQTDFDGTQIYSKVIALKNNIDEANIYIANNTLQINLNAAIETSKIEIYDAVGRIVYSDNITTTKKINTANFNSGIYIVKITTPINTIVQKVKF